MTGRKATDAERIFDRAFMKMRLIDRLFYHKMLVETEDGKSHGLIERDMKECIDEVKSCLNRVTGLL